MSLDSAILKLFIIMILWIIANMTLVAIYIWRVKKLQEMKCPKCNTVLIIDGDIARCPNCGQEYDVVW